MFSPEAQAFRKQVEKNFMFNFDAQQRMKLEAAAGAGTLPSLPAQPLPTGTKPDKGDAKAAARAEKDRMRLLQQRIDVASEQRQIELDLEKSFQSQISSLGEANGLLQARINGTEEEFNYQNQINKLVEQFGEEKRPQIELFVNENKELSKQLKLQQEQQKEAQRLEQIYGQLGQTIATGVSDMLMAAVDQTKSLAEVASNMLRNLANQLLQVAVNTALFSLFPGSSLFKALPRFADGGSISGGKPAIVGERGPELFMPGRSGSIVPNNAMGGTNIVVNVSSQGGVSSEGEGADNRRLGEAIGVAVRQELIRQKRPGGLLS
jgi:hypothetical protein